MEKTKISTLIFDWGGVLTDNQIGKAVHKELLKTTGCRDLMSEEEFQEILAGIDVLDDLTPFVKEINKYFDIDLSLKAISKIFRKVIVYHPDVIEFVKTIKEKYRTILLSNNHYINLENMKKHKKVMFEIFEEVYFSCEYKIAKPDKEFYLLPLDDFQLKSKECVFIDDREENINGAKEVGMNTILYINLDQLKEELKKFNVEI